MPIYLHSFLMECAIVAIFFYCVFVYYCNALLAMYCFKLIAAVCSTIAQAKSPPLGQ